MTPDTQAGKKLICLYLSMEKSDCHTSIWRPKRNNCHLIITQCLLLVWVKGHLADGLICQLMVACFCMGKHHGFHDESVNRSYITGGCSWQGLLTPGRTVYIYTNADTHHCFSHQEQFTLGIVSRIMQKLDTLHFIYDSQMTYI